MDLLTLMIILSAFLIFILALMIIIPAMSSQKVNENRRVSSDLKKIKDKITKDE